MASFSAGTTFTDGVANDVTAAKLAALVNAATPTSGLIQDRTAETSIASNDTLLFGDASASDDLKRITVANFRSAATFGTTTSTAATITSGTITNLASTTGTIATLNSTTGTITTGVIPTLTSTTLITTGTGTAASPAIVPTGDTNTGILFPAADTIAFSEGGVEAMRIDSSGNVGIGIISPSKKLEVYNTSNTLQINSVVRNDNSGTGVAAIGFNVSSSVGLEATSTKAGIGLIRSDPFGGGSLAFFNNNSGVAGDFTTADEKMRINTSGNVGIGTASPVNKISIESSGAASSEIDISLVSGTGNKECIVNFGKNLATNDRFLGRIFYQVDNNVMGFNTNNTERLRIDASGSLILAGSTAQKASGTTWSNPSDIRIKKNIRDYEKGLDSLMQVRVREWEYNGKAGTVADTKSMGVVADEVQTILPDTVSTYKAKLNPEDEEDSDIKKFDATEITWLLVKAVQELSAKVTALEAA